ncbi:uncharacterized protein LOC135498389 [Lineus longissimus]|uniref:uncharacterized protein LOC135498389 n=1 Tax=Lineus longissimus TaxID=88925 RepID=UPI00315D3E06
MPSRRYERLINDRTFADQTVSIELRSRCECALVCFLLVNCTTINVYKNGRTFNCYQSEKRATCMEKEEVEIKAGYAMYEIMEKTVLKFKRRGTLPFKPAVSSVLAKNEHLVYLHDHDSDAIVFIHKFKDKYVTKLTAILVYQLVEHNYWPQDYRLVNNLSALSVECENQASFFHDMKLLLLDSERIGPRNKPILQLFDIVTGQLRPIIFPRGHPCFIADGIQEPAIYLDKAVFICKDEAGLMDVLVSNITWRHGEMVVSAGNRLHRGLAPVSPIYITENREVIIVASHPHGEREGILTISHKFPPRTNHPQQTFRIKIQKQQHKTTKDFHAKQSTVLIVSFTKLCKAILVQMFKLLCVPMEPLIIKRLFCKRFNVVTIFYIHCSESEFNEDTTLFIILLLSNGDIVSPVASVEQSGRDKTRKIFRYSELFTQVK